MKINRDPSAGEIYERAYSRFEIKAVDETEGDGIIRGVATTPSTDRVGDIVEPKGAVFTLPLPLLWQHSHGSPIGNVTTAKTTSKGIDIEAKVALGVLPEIDRAWKLIKAGLVRGLSIGFRSLEFEPIDPKNPWGGLRFLKWEWLELSSVTIPANADATISAIKAYDDQYLLRAASGASRSSSTIVVPRQYQSHLSGVSESSSFNAKGSKEMKVSIPEQIANFEAERSHKSARLQELMQITLDEGRTWNEDESKEYSQLEGEVSAIDKQVEVMKRHEKLLLTTTPVGGNDPQSAAQMRQDAGRPSSVIFSRSNKPAGTAFTRLCMAVAAGKGSESDTERYIQRNFRDTPEVGAMYKAAVAAGNTSDSTWAAPLVNYTDLASEFIELLRPVTIVGRLSGVRRVPFNVRMGRTTSGASAQWVGQGLAKPVTRLSMDSVTLDFTKLATIIVLTQELVRFSTPSAEAVARDEIVGAVAQAIDQTFIDPSVTLQANVSPASITNGAPSQGSTGNTVAQITADLTWAMTVPGNTNIDMSSGQWIMRPQTAAYLMTKRSSQDVAAFPGMAMNGGTLYGFPVVVSGNMPTQSGGGSFIVFAVGREILLADDGATRVDASDQASLQMDDDPQAGAQAMVSLWQNNLVGLRAERFINWARRRDAGVAVITGVNY